MPAYKSPWDADRALSNAKFESYKLSFDDDDDERVRIIRFAVDAALPGRTLKPETEHRLGYREARNRAKWNHLACGPGSQVAWIDSEGVVWLAALTETVNASPREIVKLPEALEAASSSAIPAEYPVVRYLGKDNLWIASDGLGRLYTVDAASREIQASYELLDSDTNRLMPSRLHAVRQTLTGWQLLLSAQTSASSQDNKYCVMLAELPTIMANEQAALHVTLKLYGPDLPSFCAFHEDKCCIGSTSLYRNSLDVPADHPTDIEAESDPQVTIDQPQPVEVPARPALNWMQDRETVTLTFVLPAGTRTKDIKVTLRAQDVSILVTETQENKNASLPLPRLLQAWLWDLIDASSSTWTWEADPGGSAGTLMLHLEKRNEGTRWPYLFSQDKVTDLPTGYADIDETQDRSELLKQIEALQKYTSETPASTVADDLRQRGSLLGDEFDEDIDHAGIPEGRNTVFTWLNDLDTNKPRADIDKRAEATEVLSLHLPCSAASQTSIIIKHDIDGLLFAMPDVANDPWQQQSLCPAIAFILASKRDVGQVYHFSHRLCIGLETGIPIAAQKIHTLKGSSAKNNVYCYYPPAPGSKDRLAPQKLLSLLDPTNGAVLGAVAIERRDSAVDLAVLCERALVVIEGVL